MAYVEKRSYGTSRWNDISVCTKQCVFFACVMGNSRFKYNAISSPEGKRSRILQHMYVLAITIGEDTVSFYETEPSDIFSPK